MREEEWALSQVGSQTRQSPQLLMVREVCGRWSGDLQGNWAREVLGEGSGGLSGCKVCCG
jgi:hypothetical protein